METKAEKVRIAKAKEGEAEERRKKKAKEKKKTGSMKDSRKVGDLGRGRGGSKIRSKSKEAGSREVP